MKKIYALAAVALMAGSAMAQNGAPLYMTGNYETTESGKWNPENPDQFTWDATAGEYKIQIADLAAFCILTQAGTWDEIGAADPSVRYYCNYGDEPGVAKPLTNVKGDLQDNIMTPWMGTWDVVVAGDLSTITLTTNSPKPATKVYMRGDFADGWPALPEWCFENVSDTIYKLIAPEDLASGLGFKFADEGWAKINIGGDKDPILMDVETTVWNNGGGNITLSEDWEKGGVCWLQIADDCMVFFSNDGDAECPFDTTGVKVVASENGAATYYTLQGVRVANPENGLFIVVKNGKATKAIVK